MNISKIKAVYFSPTGNTKRIVLYLAKELAKNLQAEIETYDFTLSKDRTALWRAEEGDLVLFGMPVYAGRIPNKMLPVLQNQFEGNETPAIPIVTFGNRSYDDGLSELCYELKNNGFQPVAAAAIVMPHVFSSKIAADRPDVQDMRVLDQFVRDVSAKILKLCEHESNKGQDTGSHKQEEGICVWEHEGKVPGNQPPGPYYTPLGTDGKPAKFLKAKPCTDLEKCDHCKACAKVCPMDSISVENPTEVSGICIKCQACIHVCEKHAKYFDDPAFLSHVQMLEENYMRRAVTEVFV